MYSVPSTTKSTSVEESEGNKVLWCTGNDIEWYNGTTGELKLKNLPKVADWFPFKLSIFLDDTELFSLVTVLPWSSLGSSYPFISWERGEIEYSHCICGYRGNQDHLIGPNCGHTILKQHPGRYFIFNTYLNWPQHWTQEALEQMASFMGQDCVDEIVRAKAAFEQGWDKFIEQLKKEGRYRE